MARYGFLLPAAASMQQQLTERFTRTLISIKKAQTASLQLSGRATIVEDDGEAFLAISNYSTKLAGRLVLVKMKIQQAEYFENKVEPIGSLKDKCRTIFNQFFVSNPHRVYNFS